MADTHVQPTVSPVKVKHQDDDAEKASECPDERRQVTEQIEDTANVKITKEKSQPLDQGNRNSPDSSFFKEQCMGLSIARGGTEAGTKSPKRPEKTMRIIKCSRGKC